MRPQPATPSAILSPELMRFGPEALREHVARPVFRYGEYCGDQLPVPTGVAAADEPDEPPPPTPAKRQPLSFYVEKYISIDRKPFRFMAEVPDLRRGTSTWHDRGYLRFMYDLERKHPQGCRNQIWHTARQVEKSTTQSAKSIVLGICNTAFKTLYVAPRFDQVSVFSNQRFRPMAEDSEAMMEEGLIKPRSSKHLWQVGQKEFMNRSFFNFRSCYMTADGCRGISAHHLMIDEIQDIISDNIPVLEECQSHYGWETGLRFRSYAGTPKTNNNALTRRYRQSAQFEWMTRCEACNHWNYPDAKIIGLTSYICTRCGKSIDPHQTGRWIVLNREKLDSCWGFRIPQMIVPFKTHADIYQKMTDPNISQLRFHNEVMGLPYDEGEIVLTEADLRRACLPAGVMKDLSHWAIWSHNTGTPLFAGLDYGTGEGESPSYTVLSLGYFDTDFIFRVVYLKRFVGRDAALAQQPAIIDELCRTARVRMMMADWGFGAHQNARLVSEYGWDWSDGDRILMQAMYVRQRLRARFDHVSYRYLLDRNESMASVIDALRTRRIRFEFAFESLEPFASDFTTIYIEYSDTHGTSKYDHVDPDDAFHSVSYAYFAGLQYFNRLVAPSVPQVDELDPDDLGYDR